MNTTALTRTCVLMGMMLALTGCHLFPERTPRFHLRVLVDSNPPGADIHAVADMRVDVCYSRREHVFFQPEAWERTSCEPVRLAAPVLGQTPCELDVLVRLHEKTFRGHRPGWTGIPFPYWEAWSRPRIVHSVSTPLGCDNYLELGDTLLANLYLDICVSKEGFRTTRTRRYAGWVEFAPPYIWVTVHPVESITVDLEPEATDAIGELEEAVGELNAVLTLCENRYSSLSAVHAGIQDSR